MNENINEKQESSRVSLYDDVVLRLKENIENVEILDEWKTMIDSVLTHGLSPGSISSMILYEDTTEFYKVHQDEITELITRKMFDSSYRSLEQMFLERWEVEDPFVKDINNQNLLALKSFELICDDIQTEIENETFDFKASSEERDNELEME